MSAPPQSAEPDNRDSPSPSAGPRSTSRTRTPPTTANRVSIDSETRKSGNLIVTRGLEELLENERRQRHSEEPKSSKSNRGRGKPKSRRRSPGQAPNFIICYLCGRQFGSASIDIHRPQCYLKCLIAWERGDPATRGSKPMSPDDHEKMMKARTARALTAGGAVRELGTGSKADLRKSEMYNQLQIDTFNQVMLSPCPNCGRTFLPDRLQVHLRSCKPGSTAKPRRTAASPIHPSASALSASSKQPLVRPQKNAKAPTSATKEAAASNTPPLPSHHDHNGEDYRAPESSSNHDAPSGSASPSPFRSNSHSAPELCATAVIKPVSDASASSQCSIDVVEITAEEKVEDGEEEGQERREAGSMEQGADLRMHSASVAASCTDPEMSDTSAHKRPASTEPCVRPPSPGSDINRNKTRMSSFYSLSNSKGCAHAAGSRPRHRSTPSAPRILEMPLVESDSADEDEAHADEARTGQVVECDLPSSAAEHCTQSNDNGDAAKKIKLNNVSHFKNVPSRLHRENPVTNTTLVPCRHCGRTFLPERVQKHEACCVERSKTAAQQCGRMPVRPNSAAAVIGGAKPLRAAKLVGRSKLDAAATASLVAEKAKFCGGCGAKVAAGDQKFCIQCGAKLL